jgi:hypothetical protein
VNAVSCEPKTVIDIWELRGEAAEARCLAVKFKDRETVGDLLSYAAALEFDAMCCEQTLFYRASNFCEDNARLPAQTNRHHTSVRH